VIDVFPFLKSSKEGSGLYIFPFFILREEDVAYFILVNFDVYHLIIMTRSGLSENLLTRKGLKIE
jgi:hypothetical protein